jgi:hypothetical protein
MPVARVKKRAARELKRSGIEDPVVDRAVILAPERLTEMTSVDEYLPT